MSSEMLDLSEEQPPQPPESRAVGDIGGAVLVSWEAVPWAQSYDVLRSASNDVEAAVAVGTNITEVLEFIDDSAAAGVTYNYWVVARNSAGSATQKTPSAAAQNTKLWEYRIGLATIRQAPSIGVDGSLIFTCSGSSGRLLAMNTNGTPNWEFRGPAGGFLGSPAVAPNGDIYAVANNHRLYAFDRNGDLKWTNLVSRISFLSRLAAAVAANGDIIITTPSGQSALAPDGTLKWSHKTFCSDSLPSAINRNGIVYAAPASNQLLALDPNGNLLWSLNFSRTIFTPPVALENGNVVVGVGRSLFELDPRGRTNRISNMEPSSSVPPTPVADASGKLYFVDGQAIVSLDADGTRQELFRVPASGEGFALDAQGRLYFSTWPHGQHRRGMLCVRSPDGTLATNLFGKVGNYLTAPTLAHGILVVASENLVYGLRSDASLATNGWPMARQNARQTGSSAGNHPEPEAPKQVEATTSTLVERVDLTWESNRAEVRTEIWRATSTNLAEASMIASNLRGLRFSDTNAAPGVACFYWVRATNELGASEFSGPIAGSAAASVRTLWKATSAAFLGAPTLGKDGRIYAARHDNALQAWSPEGVSQWILPRVCSSTNETVMAGPNGNVNTSVETNLIVATSLGKIVAKNIFPEMFILPGPRLAISGDGTIYGSGPNLQVLSPAGELRWKSDYSDIQAIDAQGFAYVTPWSQHDPVRREVQRIDPVGGRASSYLVDNGVARLIPYKKGALVIDRGGVLSYRDANGALQWDNGSFTFGDPLVAGADGSIYAGSPGGLVSLTPDGSIRWTNASKGTAALVSKSGTVFLNAKPGLAAIDPQGATKWAYVLPNDAPSSAFVMSDAGILVFTGGQQLCAVETGEQPVHDSWSTRLGNMQRTSQLLPGNKPILRMDRQTLMYSGAETPAQLQSSRDLSDWQFVRELDGSAGSIEIRSEEGQRFFRIVSAN